MSIYGNTPTTARKAGAAGRLPVSAHYLRTVRIKSVGMLGRAYDQQAVDALLERLALDVECYAAERQDLEDRLYRLTLELDERKHGRLPNATPDEIPEQAITAQRQAQRYADQLIASAQNGAAQITKTARTQAEQIVRAAYERAEKAAQDYRSRAGKSYSADREEVERLVAVLDWLLEMFDGFATQFGAYHEATRVQLTKVRDRLAPPEPKPVGTDEMVAAPPN